MTQFLYGLRWGLGFFSALSLFALAAAWVVLVASEWITKPPKADKDEVAWQ